MVGAADRTSEPRFDDVVDRYQREVYRFAFRLTGHHQDAEDLAQEVFIKVHAKLGSYRGEASLKSWLFRIAVNTFLNKRRKKALSLMNLRDDFDRTLKGSLTSPHTATESVVIREHVDQALEELSPRERSAFALRHYSEFSVKEVAEALDVAEGTVKSLLYRSIQKLRARLAFLVEEG